MKLILLLLAVGLARAQNGDFSAAPRTIPWTLVDFIPGTCRIGETYYELATGNVKLCKTANTWTTFGSGGGATLPTTSSLLIGDGAGGAIALTSPTQCSAGSAPTGISATGAATGCAVIGAATYSSQLLDLRVARTSATRLTVGTCASGATCTIWQGNNPYYITGGCTMDSDGVGSSAGTTWQYVSKVDSLVHVGHASGTVGTSTTCTDDGVITDFPSGTIPLAMWSITAGNFPTETLTGSGVNDRRPWFRMDSGSGVQQSYKQVIGWVNSGGVGPAGDLYTTAGFINGGKNGAVLVMNNTTGSTVVVRQELLEPVNGIGGWDGNAPIVKIGWYQSNGPPSGGVRWDVSVQCRRAGSSATPAFGTAGTTLVTVPASGVWAFSLLTVPTTDGTHSCLPGDKMDIQIANSPSGTGTTYPTGGSGGDFFLGSIDVRIVQ